MSQTDAPLVLIVDDEPAQIALLSYNLKSAGFRIATARDGEEALLAMSELGPDVVLLDWMLPRVSGLEACRQIKATPEGRGGGGHHGVGPVRGKRPRARAGYGRG